jgi:hypothetical protein
MRTAQEQSFDFGLKTPSKKNLAASALAKSLQKML